jgi:hypothetical protein
MILMKNQSCLLKLKKILIDFDSRIIKQISCSSRTFIDATNIILIQLVNLVIGGPHGDMRDLQEEKSLLIRGGKALTVVVCFSKIQVWIVVPLMLHVILLKLSCRWVADGNFSVYAMV